MRTPTEDMVPEPGAWEPDALRFAREKMVVNHPYSIVASVAIGSAAMSVTGDFKGVVAMKSSPGDRFIHLESSVMHHYVDVDFVREIRPMRRIDVF